MLWEKQLLNEIKKKKGRKIFLQVPEGLKTKALDLAGFLEKHGIQTFLCCETCYGACDLRDKEAKILGCDLLVHLGHSDMGIKSEVPVIYWECRMDLDPVPVLKKYLKILSSYQKISLFTTLQFLSSLEKAKGFLEKQGKTVLIGKPRKAKYPGQILGCDYSAVRPEADCYLFLGSGEFYPSGLVSKTNKPVFFLDMEKMELRRISDRFQRIRFARIERAKEMERFGVLVSTKPGQLNLKAAKETKKILESKGKKAWILVFDEITPEKLLGLNLECLVNCACPRITDDFEMFKKPVLSPEDVKLL